MSQLGIHITGRSGAGVSTLGSGLAAKLGIADLETDVFYWQATDPPFRLKRPIDERIERIIEAMDSAPHGWVLSGSLVTWGGPLVPRFSHAICVDTPTHIRMARIKAREQQRYGARIEPGGDMFESSQAFIDWASWGRPVEQQQAFLASLHCPCLTINGGATESVVLAQALDFVSIANY
jgi:adenylate kinase family enzyme